MQRILNFCLTNPMKTRRFSKDPYQTISIMLFVIIIDKIVSLHMLLDILEVMPLKLNNYSRQQKNFTYN